MPLEHNPNHAPSAVLKLAAPFWGKPRWAALVVACANEIQELENAIFDVIASRYLDNATGPRLAALGRLVGQLDPGLGEEMFRRLIRVRIAINRSGGRYNDVRNVLNLLGFEYELFPTFPASLQLNLYSDWEDNTPGNTLTADDAELATGLVADTLGAGVGLQVLIGEQEDFSWGQDSDDDVGGDWGQDSDDDVGAKWMFAVEAK